MIVLEYIYKNIIAIGKQSCSMIEKKEIWIFLPHSSDDFDKVRKIRNYLEEKSYRPLMFYLKCLESDEEIYDLITREIDVRTRFILCDSEYARGSDWVKREMDYIANQDPPRSFLRIDLSQSDDIIHRQLDSYVNQMNIYISCTRNHNDMFSKIRLRLNKYDLNVLPDLDSFESGNYAYEIEKQISHAANNGYYIFLYSKDIVNSSFVAKEFKLADKLGANVLLFTLDEESDKICCNDCSLGKYRHINVSKYSNEDKADAITNRILERILPVGGLMTFAENFRSRRLGVKDEEEAIKLEKHLRLMAENSANPAALEYIGKCYEYGLGGETIDLRTAFMYYKEKLNEQSSEELSNHLKELHMKIYGNSSSRIEIRTNFLQRLKSIFKK